ncbi:MAG: extracellular solute-binding protein [Roseiflexus sp.]|nr:extracellular solute-binding protein [Roseiflexus sp.]MCS7287760.1 extracellular solute-binding protein [Roseiflexus sp.]MDW8233181.1 extracellular solute-binding protein [Roseiflexaceae bacterium]
MLILILAACGQPEAVPLTPAPEPAALPAAALAPLPSPTVAPTATPSPTPTPVPEPLTVWAAGDEARRDALTLLLADAAAAAGVPIRIRSSTPDAMIARLRVDQIDGRPPPDVIWGDGNDLAILRTMGLIQAVRPTPPDDTLSAVITGATADDRQWGAPVGARGFMLLLYNRKLVENPPHTVDALIATARANTGSGRVGLVAGWTEARWFALWLDITGGALLDANGMPALDAQPVVAALELLRTVRRFGPTLPSTYDEGAQLFRRGKAALAIDGDWALDSYRGLTDTLELGIAPLPLTNRGTPATAPLTGVYLMYGVALEGQRLAQAEALAATLREPAWQSRIARDLGMLPASIAALNDPAVTDDPALAAAAAYASRAPGIPPTRSVRCAWDAIEVDLPPFLLGRRTTAETAASMQRRAMECAQP